jgi:hypothetical protein
MRALLALAACAAALWLPQAAVAAVRCVPAGGPGCTSGHPNITAAVAAAADDDEVRIAAGVYAESVGTTKRLSFVGAGNGSTVIAPPFGNAFSLARGGSLRSLRAVGPTGVAGATAVLFQPDVDGSFAYSLTDVVAVGGNATDPGLMGFPGSGLHVSSLGAARIASVTVTRGSFQAGTAPTFTAYGAWFTGLGASAELTGSATIGPLPITTSLYASSGATVSATGVTARGSTAALVADATAHFRRSRLEGRIQGLVVTESSAATATAASVTDSLITAESLAPVDAIGLSAHSYSGGSQLTIPVHGSTIVAGGEDPTYAVGAHRDAAGPSTTIELRNSIARLTGTLEPGDADILADRGNVTAANSSFATRRELNGGTVTAPGAGTNLTADPLFTPGAFTLQVGSPLIDRGDPAIVAAGQLDLAGNPRSIGAAPDIGAFEYRPAVAPPPPPPANRAPRLSAASMTNRVFAPVAARASGRRARVKRGTTFRYRLSEAAVVTVVIERKLRRLRHRPRWRRAGMLRAGERAGRQATFFSGRLRRRALAPGRYRARIRARDTLGARSAERRLSFRVVRAR